MRKELKERIKGIDPKRIKEEEDRQIVHLLMSAVETLFEKIEEVLPVKKEELPADAQFKGYEEVIVQDIRFCTENIRFRKEKYYSSGEKKTYLAKLPVGYSGQFGPGIKAWVVALYYGAGMSEPKIWELLHTVGMSISAGQLSNLLIKEQEVFHEEKMAVVQAGLSSSSWQHLDSTTSRVAGKREHFPVGEDLTEEQLETCFDAHLPKLGSQQRKWIKDALAIGFYRSQDSWPVVQLLLCDDAPQFNWLTIELALCWIHEGRHYKKLRPSLAYSQQLLETFCDQFWQFYRKLLDYRQNPSTELAESLQSQFDQLFAPCQEGYRYEPLEQRKALSRAKKASLLMVLSHPEILLHNNPAELGVRQRVRKRDVSLYARTRDGIRAWDTFQTLVATANKLGVNLYEYVFDRISQANLLPSLAALIGDRAPTLSLSASWNADP